MISGAAALGSISIHAPPRGATVDVITFGSPCQISIHAPPRGATDGGVARRNRRVISIHAPPRGATRSAHVAVEVLDDFNSRPSARGDKMLITQIRSKNISIHAPPRGATARLCRMRTNYIQFQFTPLREGRHAQFASLRHALLFQFTPLREGRPEASKARIAAGLFQFTPLREGRRGNSQADSQPSGNFNSRPSARGDFCQYFGIVK